jgi:dipeptidase E
VKHIFLTSEASVVMDDLVTRFDQSVAGMKLAFVTTASEAEAGDKQWLQDDRSALTKAGFAVFDYTLTGKSEQEVAEDLSAIQVLFVAGGNTFYLLSQARKCNFEKIVKKLLENGVVYIGSSAGSIIMGPDIELVKNLDEPAKAKDLKDFAGFGIVDFVVLPHWGSPSFAEGYAKSKSLLENEKRKIVFLTDEQYVVVGGRGYQIIKV